MAGYFPKRLLRVVAEGGHRLSVDPYDLSYLRRGQVPPPIAGLARTEKRMGAPGIEIAVAVAFLSAAQAGECRKGGGTPQPRGLRRPCQPKKTCDSSELPYRIRQQILVPHGQHGKRRTGPAANVARPVEQALAQLRLPLAGQGRAGR